MFFGEQRDATHSPRAAYAALRPMGNSPSPRHLYANGSTLYGCYCITPRTKKQGVFRKKQSGHFVLTEKMHFFISQTKFDGNIDK